MRIKEKIKNMRSKIKNPFRRKDGVKFIGFRLSEVAILISIATIIGVLSGSVLAYNFFSNKTSKSINTNDEYIDDFKEAYDDVINNYYDKIDKQKLIDAAIDGMLSTLDGYTSYISPDETTEFNARMEGEYEGIGIEFITTDKNVHTITSVIPNSPALEAGLKVGDILVKVDDVDLTSKTGDELASYIRGSSKTEIKLTITRDGKELSINVKRSLITIPSVEKSTYVKNGKKIGYIEVSIFANNTLDQFKDALTSLENEKITSLVIDVRDNSGGYLHIASGMLELFLQKDKTMYQIQDKEETTKYNDKTEESRSYPIAVLINGNSASASEIIAAGLRDSYGAQIIGTKSYGKGTVQQPNDLSNGGMIKITTSKWLTPNGECVDKVGISPTIEVSQNNNYYTNATAENDDQLQKTLETLSK